MTNMRARSFSLRLLLTVVTVTAVVLAAWSTLIEPYRRQSAALTRLNDLDPTHQITALAEDSVTLSNSQFQPMPTSWHRTLVAFAVGEDRAILVRRLFAPKGLSEEDLRFVVARLRHVRTVQLTESSVSKETARILAAMPELENITAVRSNIGDAEIERLSKSTSIKCMKLTANPCSDQSITAFARMSQLEELYLRWTQLTPDGVEDLRTRLPNCDIWFHPRVATTTSDQTR